MEPDENVVEEAQLDAALAEKAVEEKSKVAVKPPRLLVIAVDGLAANVIRCDLLPLELLKVLELTQDHIVKQAVARQAGPPELAEA